MEHATQKETQVLRTSGTLNALKQVKLLDANTYDRICTYIGSMYVVHGYVPDTYMYKYQTVLIQETRVTIQQVTIQLRGQNTKK